jgi:hypothetical protein
VDRPQADGLELTDAEIDAAILSFTQDRWLKVARIAAQTLDVIGQDGIAAERAVGTRIETLVRDGKLEAQGDLKRWRWSEVRPPPAPSPRPGSSPRTRS